MPTCLILWSFNFGQMLDQLIFVVRFFFCKIKFLNNFFYILSIDFYYYVLLSLYLFYLNIYKIRKFKFKFEVDNSILIV